MRATKMTSYRSVTPPMSRASSSELMSPDLSRQRTQSPDFARHRTQSPDFSRHRTQSPDLSLDFARHRTQSPDLSLDFSIHRPLSPDVLERTLSPDFPRRSRSPARPRSLMESLLVAKMEALSTGKLVRTDSLDSCSSFGSMSSLPSDVCRCDDCLLGIVDFYMPTLADGK
ncbi:unnamed protein product, partial [Iphiclides podalirius]